MAGPVQPDKYPEPIFDPSKLDKATQDLWKQAQQQPEPKLAPPVPKPYVPTSETTFDMSRFIDSQGNIITPPPYSPPEAGSAPDLMRQLQELSNKIENAAPGDRLQLMEDMQKLMTKIEQQAYWQSPEGQAVIQRMEAKMREIAGQ